MSVEVSQTDTDRGRSQYLENNLSQFDIQGSVNRKWFQSITNKMQRYAVCLFL